MAAIGDIVQTRAVKWVVANYEPSPGEQLVRVVRNLANGRTTSFVSGAAGLEVVETPTWTVGQRVSVGGLAGTIAEMNAEEATVTLDPYHEPIKGGGHYLHRGRSTIPFWKLTLENKLP